MSPQRSGTARSRGGSGNSLLIAVLANLLRGARRHRGEEWHGPLRIMLPIDLRRRQARKGMDVTANAVTAAVVGLDGAEQQHGRLDDVRRAVRIALGSAASASDRWSAATSGVMVDALRLLPVRISHRLAVWGQCAEGVASNIGAIPTNVGQIDGHRASRVYLLGSPMMTDLTVCLRHVGDELTLGFVADAGRLGPGGTLPERVAAELDAWGVPARVR